MQVVQLSSLHKKENKVVNFYEKPSLSGTSTLGPKLCRFKPFLEYQWDDIYVSNLKFAFVFTRLT